MSLENIWSAIREIETKEDLASWQVGDVFLWVLIRERLFTHIAEQLGIYEPVPAKPEVKQASQVNIAPASVAVLPFIRRDSQGADPFTAEIIEAAIDRDGGVIVFGIGAGDVGSGSPQFETLDAEFRARYRNRAKLSVALSSKAEHVAKWQRVIEHLETELAVNLDRYRGFPRWLLVEFLAKRRGWRKLFSAASVKTLYAVNAWQLPMTAGAQAAGVHVIEPQHGVISKMHPRLSWAGQERVAYLPNEFWAFGDYFAEHSDLPNSMLKRTIGAPTQLAAKLSASHEKRSQILVIGQPQQTRNIVQFARFIALAEPGKAVALKPHPQENLSDIRDLLIEFGGAPANLTVLDPNASTLDLIAVSEFVLGVYSTAMFEAVALGCKVGILKLDGWRHLSVLVERGDATLIGKVPELRAFFDNSKPAATNGYYYAPKQAIKLV